LEGTPFEAAKDADGKEAWGRASEGSSGSWSSQGRLLGLSLDMLGLAASQGMDLRHRIGGALGVATLDLLENVRDIAMNPGFRARGRAVLAVLGCIPVKGLLKRILLAGHLAGCWGPPLWWDADRRILVRLVFPGSGTGSPPPEGRATVPPTNSGRGPPPGGG